MERDTMPLRVCGVLPSPFPTPIPTLSQIGRNKDLGFFLKKKSYRRLLSMMKKVVSQDC